MRWVVRTLRGFFAVLDALEFLFVSIAVVAVVLLSAFNGLRWVVLSIFAGDRLVMAVTAAILGALAAWPPVRELCASAPPEAPADPDPQSRGALDGPSPS